MSPDPSTAEVRLLDAAETCRLSQATLSATLGRLESQGAQIIGHLASLDHAALALTWVLSYKGLVAIALLFSLPSIIAMVLLGQGPELLHAVVPAVSSAAP